MGKPRLYVNKYWPQNKARKVYVSGIADVGLELTVFYSPFEGVHGRQNIRGLDFRKKALHIL
jgi:hypothetical protein